MHNQFYSYQRLIKNVLQEDYDGKYKSFLNEIIKTTHNLVNNKIEESDVNHKYYDLVIALSDYEKQYTREFFKNIDPNNIKESDYKTVSGILSSIIENPDFNKNEFEEG